MKKLDGIVMCFFIGMISFFLGKLVPVVGGAVFAVIIGMILSRSVSKLSKLDEGISFTSKKILQLAVILLGFSMNLNNIIASGSRSLPVILSTITVSLITSYILTKLLKLDRKIGILVGVGSSICGGSAIAATAPIINAKDEDVAKSISVIFLFNVIAAIIFPILGSALGFSSEGFGLFAGTAINDTSSVTAAATTFDAMHKTDTLKIATVVKLTRTLAIIPISLVLSIYEGRNRNGGTLRLRSLIPPFILLFLLASLITTVFPLSSNLVDILKFLSKFFIIMAMAAIGLKTDLIKLVKTGGSAIFLGFICWVLISLTSVGVQYLIGII